MLIDIQAKMVMGKGAGYERWAKTFKLKEMAKTVVYLRENGLTNFGELEKACDAAVRKFSGLSDCTKAASARMKDRPELGQKPCQAWMSPCSEQDGQRWCSLQYRHCTDQGSVTNTTFLQTG